MAKASESFQLPRTKSLVCLKQQHEVKSYKFHMVQYQHSRIESCLKILKLKPFYHAYDERQSRTVR